MASRICRPVSSQPMTRSAAANCSVTVTEGMTGSGFGSSPVECYSSLSRRPYPDCFHLPGQLPVEASDVLALSPAVAQQEQNDRLGPQRAGGGLGWDVGGHRMHAPPPPRPPPR